MNNRFKIYAFAAVLMLAGSGQAQSSPTTPTANPGDIKQDRRDIKGDKRDIRQDKRAAKREKSELKQAMAKYREDKRRLLPPWPRIVLPSNMNARNSAV